MPFDHNNGHYDVELFPFRFAAAGRCDECLVEAWERMTFGGLGWDGQFSHVATRANRNYDLWIPYSFWCWQVGRHITYGEMIERAAR